VKARVVAPEPPARPTTSGVWIAVLVVVGTSVGMLALAYDRGGAPNIRSTTGGPLLERPAARRDGNPPEEGAPRAGVVGPTAERPAIVPPSPAGTATLAEASRRVPIELYSATWCSACATAHRWLDANDIRYEEIDVDRRPGARDQLAALNPRRTLPTFDIDGDVLVGFDPDRLGSAITTAASRH
jgi:mycoredoxin